MNLAEVNEIKNDLLKRTLENVERSMVETGFHPALDESLKHPLFQAKRVAVKKIIEAIVDLMPLCLIKGVHKEKSRGDDARYEKRIKSIEGAVTDLYGILVIAASYHGSYCCRQFRIDAIQAFVNNVMRLNQIAGCPNRNNDTFECTFEIQ